MAFKRGERDHRDMLAHDGNNGIKANEPVYYSKPDWMVQAPSSKSNVELPPSRLPPYLTHDNPTPSLEAYTSKPAPFSEDGFSAFRRDADYTTSYKNQSLAEKTKAGQKRNAGPRQGYYGGGGGGVGGEMESMPARVDDDALWNFTRRMPIKGRAGELEMEFRAQQNGGNSYSSSSSLSGTNGAATAMENGVVDGYTPTNTPPIRSAGSDRTTPSKSIYQEQCDQIWAHHRQRSTYGEHHHSRNNDSAAGKVTDNRKYNPFTGAWEGSNGGGGGGGEMSSTQQQRQYEEREKERQTVETLANHYPPWATHEGEDGSIPLKNG
jgi:hypothetical protein